MLEKHRCSVFLCGGCFLNVILLCYESYSSIPCAG